MYEDFSTLLRSYRERRGLSRNALASRAAVDHSYLHHIEHGHRGAPREPIVLALAKQLRLSPPEWDRFLFAAGMLPLGLRQLGDWEDTLRDVVDVLNDYQLTAVERDEFRAVVRAIASRWRKSTVT